MDAKLKSSATIPTTEAQRYMVQLCKRFGHKVTATYEGHEGRITFEMGEASMRASPETLMIISQADDAERLGRLEQVMESHLKRFAFREPDMAVDWRRAA